MFGLFDSPFVLWERAHLNAIAGYQDAGRRAFEAGRGNAMSPPTCWYEAAFCHGYSMAALRAAGEKVAVARELAWQLNAGEP